MARTAGRYLKKDEELVYKNIERFSAGIYTRLSSDKRYGDRKPSDSINGQINIAMEYVKNHPEIIIQEVYTDYEYSGTNFERPAFQRMMEDVRTSKINCIVIKDLSRLGREYLEVGTLIEKVFPFLGVRFISINDNFDTLNPPSDGKSVEVTLKNIVNDMYAKDIAKRIKETKVNTMERGYFVGSIPPYGYKVIKEKEGQTLAIDPNTAPIIKKIFELSATGSSNLQIVDYLKNKGYTSPMQYYKNGRTNIVENEKSGWNVGTLAKLLKNEAYVGDMVQGKKQQDLVKGIEQHYTDEENWYIVENTHEPIITRELFDKVQKELIKRMQKSKFSSRRDDFPVKKDWKYKGLFFCGHCGLEMPLQTYVRNLKDKSERVYKFNCNRNYRPIEERCRNHIFEYEIDEIILKTINHVISLAYMDNKNLIDSNKEYFKYQKFDIEKGINKCNKNISNLKLGFELQYEAYVLGRISRDEFLKFREENLEERKRLERNIDELEKKKLVLKKSFRKHLKWIESILKKKELKKLDQEILNALIERIDLYRDREVSVEFRCELSFKEQFNKDLGDGELQ